MRLRPVHLRACGLTALGCAAAFDLQPDDQVIEAGQRIGLMIFSSDRDFTLGRIGDRPPEQLLFQSPSKRFQLKGVGS
jgi:hypothetical protein